VPCKSIADILRGMGEVPPSESQTIEIGSDSPAPIAPWLSYDIRASTARDVLERGSDDRSSWERSAQAARSWAAVAAAQRVKWRFTFSPKAAAKPRQKVERTAEQRERHRAYMRDYMREQRARQKVEASTNLQGAPS
jgi:hypothetical protein